VRFDRIIIDTAPTGHTLRLLSFPRFIDDFLERLITLRSKLKGASAMLNMFNPGGGGSGGGGGSALDATTNAVEEEEDARDRLREFQVRMYALEDLLSDASKSEFVVVTIPTALAMAETERLVGSLKQEAIAVKHVVVNQVLKSQDTKEKRQTQSSSSSPTPTSNAAMGYMDRLRREQGRCCEELREVAEKADGGGDSETHIDVTEVPWLDVEARSVYGLRAVGEFLS
jgi:arsenite-transporting ATPase